MPTHKHIRCTIHTKNGPLQEYIASSSPSSPTTKIVYVQSRHASQFWIKCEALPEYGYELGNRLIFRVAVDGEDVQSCWVSKDIPETIQSGVYTSDQAGERYLQNFEFTKVQLVEDQNVDEREKMGEISIWVLRSEKVREPKSTRESKKIVQAASVGRVREKLWKDRKLTHVVKLGHKKSFSEGEVYENMESIDTKEYPYVHFQIFYRSRGALMDLGLIPRIQLASPPTSPVDLIEGANDIPLEAAEKIARLRAELDSLEKRYKIKREISDVLEDDGEGEKKYNPRSKWIRTSKWSGTSKGNEKSDPIDLTTDD